jgi:hypothetical protein
MEQHRHNRDISPVGETPRSNQLLLRGLSDQSGPRKPKDYLNEIMQKPCYLSHSEQAQLPTGKLLVRLGILSRRRLRKRAALES